LQTPEALSGTLGFIEVRLRRELFERRSGTARRCAQYGLRRIHPRHGDAEAQPAGALPRATAVSKAC
jgi:hypothetical protein